jgi:hypothetical protein
MRPEVEEFAKLLIQHVRDEAIASCNMIRNPNCNSVDAIRTRQTMQAGDMDRLLEAVIPDFVDTTLFYLLHAIDDGLIQLSFKTSSGKLVDLVAAGESEMAGWVTGYGTDGWVPKFSKQRFNDDLPGLDNIEL